MLAHLMVDIINSTQITRLKSTPILKHILGRILHDEVIKLTNNTHSVYNKCRLCANKTFCLFRTVFIVPTG